MKLTSKIGLIVIALSATVVTSNAYAITQTFGSGSAVTTIQGTADFESVNALFDNPYVEGGMSFTRTNLTFDNNSCGFAGCSNSFPGFSGNYMYGVGTDGYFEMAATGGNSFIGLEFQTGTGFGTSSVNVLWSAFLNNVLVGSGNTISTQGGVIGFSDVDGFDVLRYTDTAGFGAPAFDSVRAQFTPSAVPVPAALPLMASALGIFGIARRRNKSKAA